jgi:hypothetical protein
MIVILFYLTWSNLDFGKPDSSLFQHIKKIVSSRLEMLPLEEAKRILFVVIAIGNNLPNDDITHDNVKAAMAMGGDHSGPHGVRYNIECLIFSYASYPNEPLWLHDMENGVYYIENSTTPLAPCKVARLFQWNYIGFLKVLMPSFLRDSGYKYVFISLDDVAMTSKYGATDDLNRFFDIFESRQLKVATCAVEGSPHQNMKPHEISSPGQIGQFTSMIEFQATVFEISAWECLYELVDSEYPGGWGLDLWLCNYCSNCIGDNRSWKMGIIDTMKVVHNPHRLPSRNNIMKDPNQLMIEQINHWSQERGISLTGDYGLINDIMIEKN